MKSISKLYWFILFITVSFVACNDNEDPIGPTTIIPITPPKINVSASVFGVVKNLSGDPIPNANVSIDGENIAETDFNGVFATTTMTLNKFGSNILVEKPGYFLGSKFVQPREGGRAYTEIVLVNRSLTETINATVGGTVTTNDGATIQFSPSSIRDANGDLYTGAVNVYAKWYDPTSDDLINTMPGDLRAVNRNNQFQQLATYGMLAVELESISGSSLNIADGETALLSFPLPSTLEASAPASIPLWFFDETSGYWLEDGIAAKIGSTYSAEVGHFTWWNVDIPYNFVELSGTIIDGYGNPWSYAGVLFTTNDGLCGTTKTDREGFYSLKVPKDELLKMDIEGTCNDLIKTEEIGPYLADGIKNTEVSASVSELITIKASLAACAGNPTIKNGYFIVELPNGNNKICDVDEIGKLNYSFMNCIFNNTATLTGLDYTNDMYTEPVTMNLPDQGLVDFGAFDACLDTKESFTFDLDGRPGYGINMRAKLTNTLSVTCSSPDSTYVLLAIYPFTGMLGSYEPSDMRLNVPDGTGGFDFHGCFGNCTGCGCPDVIVNITEFGSVGERVKGNWNCTITDLGGIKKTSSGDFDVIRE